MKNLAKPVIRYSWDEFDNEASNEGRSISKMMEEGPRILFGRRTIKSRARNEISLPKEGLAARIVKSRSVRKYRGSGKDYIEAKV